MRGAAIAFDAAAPGGAVVRLSGSWTLVSLGPQLRVLEAQLAAPARDPEVFWDLGQVQALDSAGATLLWRSWGNRLPAHLLASRDQLRIFERLAQFGSRIEESQAPRSPLEGVIRVGFVALALLRQFIDLIELVGQLLWDVAHLFRRPGDMPWRETSANLFKAGVLAMPVTALVGFLIGVVLSYLSALQLKSFGADIFIINILGIGITRELGPVLVAVLVAGRSGSAMTAQLGVMRVTEEIDALATMGISRTLRLVLPKVVALAIAMPLLVLWTTAVAMVGGMVSAQVQLDIAYGFFFDTLPKVVPVANLWIGLAKGFAFGVIVALIACHFGLRVRPNTESLSANTTSSVVTAITAVILADAIFAIYTREIGLPR